MISPLAAAEPRGCFILGQLRQIWQECKSQGLEYSDGVRRRRICVHSQDPITACLHSQYAGWQYSAGKEWVGMISGPMRTTKGGEEVLSFVKCDRIESRTIVCGNVGAWKGAERSDCS